MDETGRGAGRRVAAVGMPALALLGLLLYLTAPARPPVAAPEPAADPDTRTAAAPAETPEAAPPLPVSAPASAPAFDVVRVEPGGSAVVAGTAAPGAQVTVYADAEPLAQATADAEGNFVAIFDAPASAAPQVLTLGATDAAGAAAMSSDTVLLLPPAPPPAPEPEPAPPAQAGSPEAGNSVVATAPDAAQPAIAATAILRADSVEAVPTAAGPVGDRDVTLGSISYAAAGEVALAGLGTAGSLVRTYVDDRLAHEARVGADGRWSADLADVAKGVYTLRIDQLDAAGRVESRVETPFQRDFPRAPLPRPGAPGPTDAPGAVTVQPGHNLWTLARLHYGSGMYYTQIFTANRELIRDPNLIYPGQMFDLPELDGAE